MLDEEIVRRAWRLKQQGLTDHAVARACGVSVGAIRKWRSGSRRPELHPDRPGGKQPRSDCPRCSYRPLDKRQYAYRLGLYLGDGHIARQAKGVYKLEIACADAWPGLIDAAAEAVGSVLPGSRVGRRQRTGCTMVGSYSKHWPCLFPQHGPGRKHERKIELAGWQREITDQRTEEFVRGLIHSDGCRSMNRVRRPLQGGNRWYEYPRYTFTNVSLDIQRLFTDALDRLGIAWKQMNATDISVARREAVARLDGFVGAKY
ncbi:helix-turn-helix domain-containing protein [Actinomadura nitritigenes]|uniref:helix-turn-helix domain-containing protein n=1 Tax=Actinomadura nitritigenes TaxID=134602 RepID=UPI0036A46944